MSTGPEDQLKHPDSLTGTSEADASDVRDDPTLRGQDEADPDDEDAGGEATGVGEADLDPDDEVS